MRRETLIETLQALLPYDAQTAEALSQVIITHGSEDQVIALAGSEHAPVASLSKLARHKRAKIRAAVALNHNLDATERARLFEDKAVTVRRAAACRMNQVTKAASVADEVNESLEHIKNPDLSSGDLSVILSRCRYGVSAEFVEALIAHPQFSSLRGETLMRFLSYQDGKRDEYTTQIAKHLSLDTIFEILQWNRGSEAREAIAPFEARLDLATITAWGESEDVRKRIFAAASSACPSALLTQLAGDGDREVAEMAVTHVDVTHDAVVRYANNSVMNRRVLLEVVNKKSDNALTTALIRLGNHDVIQLAVRGNLEHDLEREELLQIAAKHSVSSVRREAALTQDCPSEILAELALDGNQEVRETALEHPQTPVAALIAISQSVALPWNLLMRLERDQLLDLGVVTVVDTFTRTYVRYSEQERYNACKDRLASVILEQIKTLGLAEGDALALLVTVGEGYQASLRDLLSSVASLHTV